MFLQLVLLWTAFGLILLTEQTSFDSINPGNVFFQFADRILDPQDVTSQVFSYDDGAHWIGPLQAPVDNIYNVSHVMLLADITSVYTKVYACFITGTGQFWWEEANHLVTHDVADLVAFQQIGALSLLQYIACTSAYFGTTALLVPLPNDTSVNFATAFAYDSSQLFWRPVLVDWTLIPLEWREYIWAVVDSEEPPKRIYVCNNLVLIVWLELDQSAPAFSLVFEFVYANGTWTAVPLYNTTTFIDQSHPSSINTFFCFAPSPAIRPQFYFLLSLPALLITFDPNLGWISMNLDLSTYLPYYSTPVLVVQQLPNASPIILCLSDVFLELVWQNSSTMILSAVRSVPSVVLVQDISLVYLIDSSQALWGFDFAYGVLQSEVTSNHQISRYLYPRLCYSDTIYTFMLFAVNAFACIDSTLYFANCFYPDGTLCRNPVFLTYELDLQRFSLETVLMTAQQHQQFANGVIQSTANLSSTTISQLVQMSALAEQWILFTSVSYTHAYGYSAVFHRYFDLGPLPILALNHCATPSVFTFTTITVDNFLLWAACLYDDPDDNDSLADPSHDPNVLYTYLYAGTISAASSFIEWQQFAGVDDVNYDSFISLNSLAWTYEGLLVLTVESVSYENAYFNSTICRVLSPVVLGNCTNLLTTLYDINLDTTGGEWQSIEPQITRLDPAGPVFLCGVYLNAAGVWSKIMLINVLTGELQSISTAGVVPLLGANDLPTPYALFYPPSLSLLFLWPDSHELTKKASLQLRCPPGSFSPMGTSAPLDSLCVTCPVGTFSQSNGMKECLACPSFLSTLLNGSSHIVNCSICDGGNSFCHDHGVCEVVDFSATCKCHSGYSTTDNCFLPWGAMLGTAVGAVVLLIAFLVIQRLLIWRKSLQKRQQEQAEEILDLKKAWHIDWSALTDVRVIAAGGFGAVYAAMWCGRPVAVKVMHDIEDPLIASSPDFEREVKALRSYRHPHVVLLFGIGLNADSQRFIVTEFVERGSLRHVLEEEELADQLAWPMRLSMAVDIATGIEFLHRQNPPVLHRDIKSPNILVTNTFRCKIGDLGTSRIVALTSAKGGASRNGNPKKSRWMKRKEAPASSDRETLLGSPMTVENLMSTRVGTTKWAAPEMLRGDADYTLPVDIYACGMVFWELATNDIPFSDIEWSWQVVDHVLNGKRPDWPHEGHFAINSPEFVGLVIDCWKDDPQSRPLANELLERLVVMM